MIRGEKGLAERTQPYDVHLNQITDWENQLLERAAGVFGAEGIERPNLVLEHDVLAPGFANAVWYLHPRLWSSTGPGPH